MSVTMKKGGMQGTPAKDIDAYLAKVRPDFRKVLLDLRKTIQAAAPKATEGISYQMPVFKYFGPLVYFGAFKDHCSLFGGNGTILRKFTQELKPFVTSASTIRFTPEKPLPVGLVRRIVEARVEQNEQRAMKRKKRQT